jgi:hypothetical protein
MEGINKPEQKSDKGGNASQNNDNVDKRRSMAIIHPSKNHKVEIPFSFGKSGSSVQACLSCLGLFLPYMETIQYSRPYNQALAELFLEQITNTRRSSAFSCIYLEPLGGIALLLHLLIPFPFL